MDTISLRSRQVGKEGKRGKYWLPCPQKSEIPGKGLGSPIQALRLLHTQGSPGQQLRADGGAA